MIRVAIFSVASGRPLRNMMLRDEAEADLNTGPGEAWLEGTADLARDMVEAGQVVPRPEVPALPSGGPAPLALDLAAYPAGTVMQALNPEGDAVQADDPLDPITLTMPGQYAVTVAPPWPWLGTGSTVEVSDA